MSLRGGPEPPGDVTRLLSAARDGDADSLDRLFALVYDELRRLAARQLRGRAGADTLGATGLVHEVYLKLSGGAPLRAEARAHFFALAARAMRQVLVDRARERGAGKRGGAWRRTTLGDGPAALALGADELLALEDALARLEPRQREVVECRLFAGMEESEIAALLGVSDRTVRRDWVKGRAWLSHALMLDV